MTEWRGFKGKDYESINRYKLYVAGLYINSEEFQEKIEKERLEMMSNRSSNHAEQK